MIKLNSALIGTIALLSTTAFNNAQAATIYTFTPTSGTASGTLEFASPPSTSSSAWSTADVANDVIAMEFVLDNGVQTTLGGSLGNTFVNKFSTTIESYNGTELDTGTMSLRAPFVIDAPNWNFIFSDQPGGDEVRVDLSSQLGPLVYSASGDWIEASVVPVPAAVWLFSSGMLALAGVTRRRRNA